METGSKGSNINNHKDDADQQKTDEELLQIKQKIEALMKKKRELEVHTVQISQQLTFATLPAPQQNDSGALEGGASVTHITAASLALNHHPTASEIGKMLVKNIRSSHRNDDELKKCHDELRTKKKTTLRTRQTGIAKYAKKFSLTLQPYVQVKAQLTPTTSASSFSRGCAHRHLFRPLPPLIFEWVPFTPPPSSLSLSFSPLLSKDPSSSLNRASQLPSIVPRKENESSHYPQNTSNEEVKIQFVARRHPYRRYKLKDLDKQTLQPLRVPSYFASSSSASNICLSHGTNSPTSSEPTAIAIMKQQRRSHQGRRKSIDDNEAVYLLQRERTIAERSRKRLEKYSSAPQCRAFFISFIKAHHPRTVAGNI